jgi:pimeloyl-ACP methyl ester carboxylesterase
MSGAGWPTYLGFTVGWRWSPQIFLRWFFQRDSAESLELSDEERLKIFLSPKRTAKITDPKDKAFFADEDNMRVYLATSRESFAQGYDAMCKDGYVMCTDWGFQIQDIRKDLPFVLWYGEKDANVPPIHGRTIAKRLKEDGEEDGRINLRMLDDTHASISMRDKKGYLVDILEAWRDK